MSLFRGKHEKPWRQYEFLAVDVETTGLDLANDEVISIGAVPIRDGRFKGDGNFYQEIAPSRSPSAASIAIHGLRSGDLGSAESGELVLPRLAAQMQDRIIIAHAAWVEKAFLSQRLKSYGFKYPNSVIDTAALARSLGLASRDGGYEPSLELLARNLNLPVYSPHHALGDAMTTAAVFLALVSKVEERARSEGGTPVTLRKLLELSER